MSGHCQRLIGARWFHHTVVGLILLTAVVVGLETSPAVMERFGPLLHGLDRLIIGLFVVELVLRLAAHGRRWWEFFRDPWNIFDFVIVAVCLLPLQAQFAAVLRLARVLRVLRLVTALPGLQLLVAALLKSIPSMGYVGMLLGLHFYIYAVMGVFLFGALDPQHFGSLGRSLLTLFQVVTLEGWADIMRDQLAATTVAPRPVATIAYFISFILLGTMIILNLLIGVIMNAMQEAQEERAHAEAARKGEAVVEQDAEIAAIERELGELTRRLERIRKKARAPGAPNG
jgi:voltage-gated sodium channel